MIQVVETLLPLSKARNREDLRRHCDLLTHTNNYLRPLGMDGPLAVLFHREVEFDTCAGYLVRPFLKKC
jgi:hypothetical protein